jgi:hypothetical protein
MQPALDAILAVSQGLHDEVAALDAPAAMADDVDAMLAEHSRNLLFANGARMQRAFETIVDRTRSRLDVKTVKTLFGAKTRPHWRRKGGPPRLEAMIETYL